MRLLFHILLFRERRESALDAEIRVVSLFPWVFEVFLVLSICIYNIYIYISNN